jgi:hypothetical protein
MEEQDIDVRIVGYVSTLDLYFIVWFVVDKVALAQVFLPVLQFFPVYRLTNAPYSFTDLITDAVRIH